MIDIQNLLINLTGLPVNGIAFVLHYLGLNCQKSKTFLNKAEQKIQQSE